MEGGGFLDTEDRWREPLPLQRHTPSVEEALTDRGTPLMIMGGPMGIVHDERVDIGEQELNELVLSHGESHKNKAESVTFRDHLERVAIIQRENQAPLYVPYIRHQKLIGGNAANTFAAFSTLSTLWGQREKAYLYATPTDWLKKTLGSTHGQEKDFDLLNGVPPDVHWLPISGLIEAQRERINYVFSGPNGSEPDYFEVSPSEITTPELPKEGNVFLSSSGPNIWDRIRESPDIRLFLAPGSKQVASGIPEDIWPHIFFLSCNMEEARKLLEKLDPRLGEKHVSPEMLLTKIKSLGVQHVRITAGEEGVYAVDAEGNMTSCPPLPRDHPIFASVLRRYWGEKEFQHHLNHANWNGCGDTRLGSELAAQSLSFFADYPQKDREMLNLVLANLIAAAHSFNSFANISNFPPELMWSLIGITPQVYDEFKKTDAIRHKKLTSGTHKLFS